MKGVWIYGYYDASWIADSVYDNETDALHKLNEEGWGQVIFVEFGVEIIGPVS